MREAGLTVGDFCGHFASKAAMDKAHSPNSASVSSRERAVPATALTIGGLCSPEHVGGHPLSDEVLSTCRKWALLV